MQRRPLHRWSIVLLLVARFVVGEFANAMPHPDEFSDAAAPAAAQAQEMLCPDHAAASAAGETSADSGDMTDKIHDPASHGSHCCEDDCDCACLHLSVLAIPVAMVNVAALKEHPVPAAALGHTPQRIFLLFRPPA